MPSRLPKLMVCGHARHGKDTFCEFMLPLAFTSSSIFVASRAVFPVLAPLYGYKDLNECYRDRHAHRAEWHQLIRDYNDPDRARLARELYESYDIYCGIRWHEEFLAAKAEGLFDLSIWVDASDRLPPEDSSSNTVTRSMCDIVIDNNGNLADLLERSLRFRTVMLGEFDVSAA